MNKQFDIDIAIWKAVELARKQKPNGWLTCFYNETYKPKTAHYKVCFFPYNTMLEYVSVVQGMHGFKDSQSTNDPSP